MFIRLSPAQATSIHGWGAKLKTSLTWRDVQDNEHIDFDLLMSVGVRPKELSKLQPDVRLWVLHAGCKPCHARSMVDWPAHPMRDLHGDLADVIALRATSKELKAMGLSSRELREAGVSPETMRLMALSFQGWIDLGLTLEDVRSDFTDAQVSRVFQLTRTAVNACFPSR